MARVGGLLVFFNILLMSSSKVDVPRVMMNNGLKIPALALGTYLGFDKNGIVESKDHNLQRIVEKAIDLGYRHFDTASVYKTEAEVGRGVQAKIKDGTVQREDVFITTKLWNTHHGKDQVGTALRASLLQLNTTYLDLYLMHWPMALNDDYSYSDVDYIETWRAMEKAHKEGLVKSIGVSNFNRNQIIRLIANAEIKPAAIQIEIHPNIIQEDMLQFCKDNKIIALAYSPLGSLSTRHGYQLPRPRIDDPVLEQMKDRYGKTTPQIVLRWELERGAIPVPKTTDPERLAENINIFDFFLHEEDIQKISQFNINRRYTHPSFWQTHKYYPFEKIDNPFPNPFLKQKEESSK